MEWFTDYPHRGQIALTVIVLAITAAGIWFGRKKPRLTFPLKLTFTERTALLVSSGTLPFAHVEAFTASAQ